MSDFISRSSSTIVVGIFLLVCGVGSLWYGITHCPQITFLPVPGHGTVIPVCNGSGALTIATDSGIFLLIISIILLAFAIRYR